MSPLGSFHFVVACIAIVLGALIIVSGPKGTRRHRQLGWVYVSAMLVTNATALMIYRLFGGFGPFHAAAIIGLVSIAGGVLSIRAARRARLRGDHALRARRIEGHYWWICFNYVGLIAAFASEAITRVPALRAFGGGPGLRFAIAVGGATAAVFIVGTWAIMKQRVRMLQPFQGRRSTSA
jgi:uncharacterized membrane protein